LRRAYYHGPSSMEKEHTMQAPNAEDDRWTSSVAGTVYPARAAVCRLMAGSTRGRIVLYAWSAWRAGNPRDRHEWSSVGMAYTAHPLAVACPDLPFQCTSMKKGEEPAFCK